MFTGIVSAVGRIAKATRETGNPKGLPNGRGTRETGLALTIRAPYKGVKKGESIAVNGACLTVERVVTGGFSVHVVETTEGRTLFAEYRTGRRVHLERAVRAARRCRALRPAGTGGGAVGVDPPRRDHGGRRESDDQRSARSRRRAGL